MPPPSDAPPPHKSGVPGWAKWVIGCGAMLMCCCPIGGAVLFPVFSQARQAANSSQSLIHMKQIGAALSLYTAEHDDFTPPSQGWNAALTTYGPDLGADNLTDPLLRDSPERRGYGMNLGISMKSVVAMEDPSKVIAFALTKTPGKDAQVTPDTLRPASQQPYRTIWATADGAVKKALIDEAQRLQWKPVLMKK